MLNLDTHILVSMLAGDLSDRDLRLIQGEQLVISDDVCELLSDLRLPDTSHLTPHSSSLTAEAIRLLIAESAILTPRTSNLEPET